MYNYINLHEIEQMPVMLPGARLEGTQVKISYHIKPEVSYIANYCGLPVILHKETEKQKFYTISDGLYGLKLVETTCHTIKEVDNEITRLIDGNRLWHIAKTLDGILWGSGETVWKLRISDFYRAADIIADLLIKYRPEVK